jgi:hypothetical protein
MKTRIVTVRITDKLYQRIQDIADAERRSLANVAMLLFEQGLDHYVTPGAKPEKSKIRIVK